MVSNSALRSVRLADFAMLMRTKLIMEMQWQSAAVSYAKVQKAVSLLSHNDICVMTMFVAAVAMLSGSFARSQNRCAAIKLSTRNTSSVRFTRGDRALRCMTFTLEPDSSFVALSRCTEYAVVAGRIGRRRADLGLPLSELVWSAVSGPASVICKKMLML